MAHYGSLKRHVESPSFQSLQHAADGDVTEVEAVPAWHTGRALPLEAPETTPAPSLVRQRPASRDIQDTRRDVPSLAHSQFALLDAHTHDEAMDERPMRDTLVDIEIPRTDVDHSAIPDPDEELDATLLDTPTLLVPLLAPSRGQTDDAPSQLEPPPATPQAASTEPRLRLGPPPGVPTSTTASTTPRRVPRRTEHEALARVLALAKPRLTPPRPRPILRPLRSAEG